MDRPPEHQPRDREDGDADASAAPPNHEGAAIPPLPANRNRSADVRTPFPAPLDPAHGFRRSEEPGKIDELPATGREEVAAKAVVMLPPMPSLVRRTSMFAKLWFLVAFVAPVVLGGIYMLLLAPNQYVTEFRFSVREPVSQSSSGSAGAGSLAALFGGNPTPGTDLLDNYTVVDYVRSQQAAHDLDERLQLRRMFSAPADPIARLRRGASTEALASYWKSMVYSDYDPASGLAVVRVRAFSPQDSYRIATTLKDLSSDLVNNIGIHSQQDSVRFARVAVERATREVAELRTALRAARQQDSVIDPTNGAAAGNAQLVNALTDNLNRVQGQIVLLERQLQNPNAPQIRILRDQLASTRQQIEAAGGVIGGGKGGLSGTVGRFEDINTRLQNATAVLLNSVTGLSQAEANADAQRLYMTTYVQPMMPESSTYPARWTSTLIIALVAAMIWMIGALLANSIREHG